MNIKLEQKYIAFVFDLAKTSRAEGESEAVKAWNYILDTASELHTELLKSGYGQ